MQRTGLAWSLGQSWARVVEWSDPPGLIKPLIHKGITALSGNSMGFPQRKGDQRQVQQVYISYLPG